MYNGSQDPTDNWLIGVIYDSPHLEQTQALLNPNVHLQYHTPPRPKVGRCLTFFGAFFIILGLAIGGAGGYAAVRMIGLDSSSFFALLSTGIISGVSALLILYGLVLFVTACNGPRFFKGCSFVLSILVICLFLAVGGLAVASRYQLDHEPYTSPNTMQSTAQDLWKKELKNSKDAPLICYLEKKLNCTGFTQPCCTSVNKKNCTSTSDQCLPLGACDAVSVTPCVEALADKTNPYDFITLGASGGIALLALFSFLFAAFQ